MFRVYVATLHFSVAPTSEVCASWMCGWVLRCIF